MTNIKDNMNDNEHLKDNLWHLLFTANLSRERNVRTQGWASWRVEMQGKLGVINTWILSMNVTKGNKAYRSSTLLHQLPPVITAHMLA